MLTRTLNLDEGVLTHEIALGALRMKPGDPTRADEMRIATILRGWGYVRGERVREAGEQVRRYRKARSGETETT
jgi:hypothetical protein